MDESEKPSNQEETPNEETTTTTATATDDETTTATATTTNEETTTATATATAVDEETTTATITDKETTTTTTNEETTTVVATSEETTGTSSNERAAGASGGDLLKTELDSLEEMVVQTVNSDETKGKIESMAHGLTQSAKEFVSKVEAKVGTLVSNSAWPSLLQKKPNEEAASTDDQSLPQSDNTNLEQAPRSTDENQPLVGGTPQTARTSWTNCCGLLEAFVRPSDH